MSETKYPHAQGMTLKQRWDDVIKYKSFWLELEDLMLSMQSEAWFSGYRSGKREARQSCRKRERGKR